MKIKSIKMRDYFQINNPMYIYLKLIPNNSIRNYNSDKIAKVINKCYRSIAERIYKEEKKFFYNTPTKISYYIHITKLDCEFYFVIPQFYKNLFLEKINDCWKGITVEIVNNIPRFKDSCTKYALSYTKEDALSLNTDKRSNTLLSSNLNVVEILDDTDRIGIFYNFIPCSSYAQFSWRGQYKQTINKYKNLEPIDRDKKDKKYICKLSLHFLLNTIDNFISAIQSILNIETKKEDNHSLELAIARAFGQTKKISNSTTKKEDATIVNTQVVVLSESENKTNEYNNARAVVESFKSISEDNVLEGRKINKKINFDSYNINTDINKISCEEASNFIALPGRELLQEHKYIKKIDVLEREVPKELQEGYISIGKSVKKGVSTDAYMSDDKNLANLGLTVLGPQGAGKTTYLKRYSKCVVEKGEGLIVLDYIKNCDLANSIREVVPIDKLIELDLSNPKNLQSFSFNELKIDSKEPFEILECANLKTQQTIALIDSINDTGDPLSPRMRRFLSSACNIVYINNDKSLKDVIRCLENYIARDKYINLIPNNLKEMLEDEVSCLKELNDVDKKTNEVIGTKDSKIEHILDRINLLREDLKLKFMFNMDSSNNIDFVDCMNKGKVILIKMPEAKFNSKYVKNVLVTFFISKIWLSCQVRGNDQDKPLRNHIVLDEIFQAPTSENILKDILVQARKFQLKLVFSAHYLSQIETIREALKASGSSYMLFSGTDKKNFKELEQELEPYQLEDLLNLKEYSSMNLMRVKNGYESFITDLKYKS